MPLALLLSLSIACSSDETVCSEAAPTTQCHADLGSKRACLAEGGCWGIWGAIGVPTCNCPAADAGAPCASSSECEGYCVGDDGDCSLQAGGACSDMESEFGCFCLLTDTGAPEICID